MMEVMTGFNWDCQIKSGKTPVSISLSHRLVLIAPAWGALCSKWGGCITQLSIAVTPTTRGTLKKQANHTAPLYLWYADEPFVKTQTIHCNACLVVPKRRLIITPTPTLGYSRDYMRLSRKSTVTLDLHIVLVLPVFRSHAILPTIDMLLLPIKLSSCLGLKTVCINKARIVWQTTIVSLRHTPEKPC